MGTDGNERLTTITGAILIVLLAVIGFTIPQLRQFIWLHLFVGMLLIGPVLLKMASTGYRFMRYYAAERRVHRSQGTARDDPAPDRLRSSCSPPSGCSSRASCFCIVGPSDRDPWLLLHKVTFIVWVVFMGLHVLGHLPAVARALGSATWTRAAGARLRATAAAVDRARRGARRAARCWRSC